MKLQLALDDLSLEQAIALAERVWDYIDIIEAGTPLIYGYGMAAVRALKERFPEKLVLADMKIMDSGALETEEAMDAGADYVTVLGVSEDATVKNCLEAAARYGREVVVDMICVPDLPGRIRALEALGVQGLAVHTGVDQQAAGRTPLDDLRRMTACAKKAKISVAGGIRPETVAEYAACGPEVVIVGGGILHAPDPVAAAAAIARQLRASE
jgi:3-hexulose-6-phosphate synthase